MAKRGVFKSLSSLIDSTVSTIEGGFTSMNNVGKTLEVTSKAYYLETLKEVSEEISELKLDEQKIDQMNNLFNKYAG